MKPFYLIIFLLCGFIQFGCEKDKAGLQPVLPSNLSFEIRTDAENPAKVSLNISSDNTNFYKIYFGEGQEDSPLVTTEKELEYTYAKSGTYTIKVQAHATEPAYVAETKSVTIELPQAGGGGGDIPETGFASPESYEGMALVWQDEFEGTELDINSWTFETGTGSNGWGNNELQYYREENTTLEDGYLIITAKEEAFEGKNYTSSRIKTQGKQSFQYGRIDIRAALPKGQGIWPALWMLGENFSTAGWPASGEIDIMEMVGGNTIEGERGDRVVHGTLHWSNAGQYASYGSGDAGGGYTLESGDYSEEFHVFSIVWDAASITWYVDDVAFHTTDITPEELSEFHQEFFFIFNVAVGGNWPGSPDAATQFPQKMIVDYVRVFQQQ